MDVDKVERTEKLSRRRYRANDPDFVAPDGGWGWLVVVACGFSNLSIFPMIQQFGLVFLNSFQSAHITNTQTTTIINVNSAMTFCVGLLNGPIYRKFSYRQMAFFGSFLVVTSLIVSTFCNSFWTYLICFGFLYGSAIGITQSANSIALNTYFKRKRSIATGISWGTTAFGPILWPHIITDLVTIYGTRGTLMVFSGFACHSIMCSLLLQPVHWHTKFRANDPIPKSVEYKASQPSKQENDTLLQMKTVQESASNSGIVKKLVSAFDLDLLKDIVFVNILVGMTLSNFVEVNFSILTPFVLKEFNFDTQQIAMFMSLLASTDIAVRFAVPLVANKLGFNVRIYFMLGCLLTSLGRVVLMQFPNWTTSLVAAVMIGFGKGLCVVYLALLIPNHVPLQKLPAAAGLQLTTMGVLFLVMGPIVGWIRDTIQSYSFTMHILNILNYLIVIAWGVELIRTKKIREQK